MVQLLDTSGFPPRWRCGIWSDLHGWIHIVSDLATWAAYYTLPILILYFASKRRDLAFTRIYWLFAAFILACGTVHLIEATIFWHPWYRLSALFKVLTAVVSWATVVALVPVLPRALALPGMAAWNEKLLKEVARRRTVMRILRTRNRTLDEFTNIASHDLKAPLRAIEHLAQWIEEDSGDKLSPESAEHLRNLRDRSHQLMHLLEDLLTYVRGDCDLHPAESVQLEELVSEIVESLEPPPGARIEFRGHGTVRAVRIALRQVLQNLLANAFQHSESPEPIITIECRILEDEAVIRLEDDGPGIPDGQHETVFAPFQTQGRPTGGSGMGLAIVKRLVQGWGGSIRSCPDRAQGSCFEFTLPLAPVDIDPDEDDGPGLEFETADPGLNSTNVSLTAMQ